MSIRLKLTIVLLAVSLIPLLFVAVFTFHNYKKSLETTRLLQFQDLAAVKAERIEAYFSGLKTEIEMSQDFYNIKKNLPVLNQFADKPNRPEFIAAKNTLDRQLQNLQKSLGLSDIMLINPEGKIIYASNPGHNPKNFLNTLPDPEQKSFSEGRKKIYFSDLFFNKTQNQSIEMLVSAPVFDYNGLFIGIIAFEVDMSAVYKIIQNNTGLGDTGETLIGKITGNEVVYLNPLRHDPLSALKKRIKIGDPLGGPIQEAAQGKTGSGQLIDYRGKKVLAAWRHIPSLRWGMVTKIDTDEAFADVINLRYLLILILGIVFLICGTAAFYMSGSISTPIKKLSKDAEIIGSGNLDCKIATDSKDEIGQLSRSFDKMTQNLKQILASREELNKEIINRQETEDRLNRSQEIAHLGSWELDIANNHLTWSDETYRIFGLKPREFSATYESFLEAVHPDDRPAVNAVYSGSLKEGRDRYEIEHRIVRKSNNEVRIVHEKCEHIRDSSGRVIRSIGMVHDITERKTAEQAVLLAKEDWEKTFNSVPDMIAILDTKHSIKRVNAAMAKRLGLNPDECVGLKCYEYIHGTSQPPAACPHSCSLCDSKEHIVEFHEDRLGGDFLVSTTPLFDDKKNLIGSVHVARDITERKKAENELKILNENLEQFAYVASHDLQEPLRIMASFSQLLEKRYKDKLDKDADEFIGYIVEAAKRMQRLITDLLAYSRAGRPGMKMAEINCDLILDKVLSNLGRAIAENNAIITRDSLPVLTANETGLIQLFQNLIANAIKFRQDEPPRLHISAEKKETEWLFSVRDNGIGIEDKYKDQIFLIFQRLHARDKYEGTGIGLAICKKIVENHNGRIWVESEPGKGTTFYFTIKK